MNKKTFVAVIIINLVLITLCSTALAAAPAITISLPAANKFFIIGDSCNTSVNITGTPTGNVSVYYPESDITADAYLTKVSSSNYQGAFTISSYDKYPAVSSSGNYIGFKRFKVKASNADGTGYAYRNYAVASQSPLTYYTNISNIARGDFVYPYTSEYNCAAYSVGILNDWLEPTNTTAALDAFMCKTGAYASRAGTKYVSSCAQTAYPDAVYYSGYHFAKVISWYSNGTPYVTQSKWGQLEVIKTYGTSPWKTVYGTPTRWWTK